MMLAHSSSEKLPKTNRGFTSIVGLIKDSFVTQDSNAGLFFGHQRKNSRRKNSKLKEKTQNSRTKLKFSAFKSGETEVNIGMECFFTSTFKGKDYGKYQKGTINLNNMNRSQNSSKTILEDECFYALWVL